MVTHLEEILTLLTILLLEIAKTFGFTNKDIYRAIFVKDHLCTDLSRSHFEGPMCQLGFFRWVISSLPAVMSLFLPLSEKALFCFRQRCAT